MSEMKRIQELTLKLLDEDLSDEESAELEQLVSSNPEAARVHIALIEQEAALRGLRKGFDVTEATLERLKAAIGDRLEDGVLKRIHEERGRHSEKGTGKIYRMIDPEIRWLGIETLGKVAAAAALLLLVTLGPYSLYMMLRHAEPQEAFLYGQEVMTPGVESAFRVFVRNGLTGKPIASAAVEWILVNALGETVWNVAGTTNGNGIIEGAPNVDPDLPEGQYTLQVKVSSDEGTSTIFRRIKIQRSFRVFLTSDKPLYQPGQTIHLRALSLGTADLRPVAGRDVILEVLDGKGNKVFRKAMKTSDYGIAACDFELADQVNTGEYRLSATVGDTTSERTVSVREYQLPKFRVDLTTDRPFYAPGETVACDLSGKYTFGKPVGGGKVQVVASEFVERFRPFANVDGTLDSRGNFHFEIPLKESLVGQELRQGDAFVVLEATVTDTAGHTQKKTLDITVTVNPIRVEVFPESGLLVQNVENILYIVTAYADGRPARTRLTVGATGETLETSEAGIVKVKLTPYKAELKLTVTAEDASGLQVTAERELRVDRRGGAFLLRTDRAVYRTGDTVVVTVISPNLKEQIFLDVVKDRRTVLTRGIDVQNGTGELALDIPADLFGTLELHAYRIQSDGNIVGDSRIIQVSRADDLKITARLDRETYRPAEKAILNFLVQGRDGDPVQAALGLSGVDEAVFALEEMQPGLARIYFLLQEEILKPRFEIHASPPFRPDLAVQEEPPEQPELEEASVVLFSAARGGPPPSREQSETFRQKQKRYEEEEERYLAKLQTAGALIPPAIFFLLILPVLGYAVLRFFRREPIEEASAKDIRSLRQALQWIAITWILGLYLPIGLMVVGSGTGSEELTLTLGIAVAIGMAIQLGYWTVRFRNNPASHAAPLLRRFLTGLPLAYIFGAGGFACLAAATGIRPRILENDFFSLIALLLLGVMILVFGATWVSGRSVVKRLSAGAWLAQGLGSTLVALGAIIVIIMIIPTTFSGREKAEILRMDRIMAEAPAAQAPMTRGKKGEQPGKGEVLVEPSRIRRYFPETLLWVPELITDAAGRGSLEIPLADSITTWRIAMSGVSSRGELGSQILPLRVFQDFFTDIDFPAALTQNDQVSIPVAVYNYLDRPQEIRLEVEEKPWCRLLGEKVRTLQVGANEVTSASFVIKALQPGRHALTVKASGSELADAVERIVTVEPDGREVVQTFNGRLLENTSREFTIPEEAIDGAGDLFVKIYPGSFSQVLEGLESIFRMPYGCFEQTSSTTYPNVLVLNYLRETGQAKPEVEMKALNFINLGYQRLVSFEVPGGGFEWFGKEPAHVVLTAYGLLEFSDMAKVYEVDPRIIRRTRNWLLSRQKGDGSWESGRRAILEGAANNFQDQVLRTTAYVAWALAESLEDAAEQRLLKAMDYVARHGPDQNDPYTLALCANTLVAGKHSRANSLLEKLGELKVVEGEKAHWTSAAEGVTHSRGRVLDIESTALAACAYIRGNYDFATINQALAWLVEMKDPRGTWHSTQATVLAMRALLAGTGPAGRTQGETHVTVTANGKVGKELTITPETGDVFHLVSLREFIQEGGNTVALEAAGESNLAYQIVATHHLPWREERVRPEKEISIDLGYDTTELGANDILTCRVSVRFNRLGTARMTIIDLGIPPGFEVITDAFEDLKKNGRIERYSTTGRQVILYLRELPGRTPFDFAYSLRAKYPVKVKTPPSQVYQYYEPDLRDEADPVELTVR